MCVCWGAGGGGGLWPFQEYFTYIEPIVHQRWAKTGERKNHLTILKLAFAVAATIIKCRRGLLITGSCLYVYLGCASSGGYKIMYILTT